MRGEIRTQDGDGTRSLIADAAGTCAVNCDVAAENIDVFPDKAPVPNHADGSQTAGEVQAAGRVLLTAGAETDVATKEHEVAQEAARTVLHEDSHGRGPLCGGRDGHVEVQILKRSGLGYLPVDAGRHVLLAVVVVGPVHGGQVEDEVADLPEELVLVDVPLVAVAAGDVYVGVNQGNAGEVGRPLDCGPVIGVSYKLGIIVSKIRRQSRAISGVLVL